MTAPIPSHAWSTACPDWQERIRSGRTPIPELPLFEAVAEKALRLFKRLRVPDMIGTPTYGEVCEPWIFELVRAVFGSYDPEARRRMIRQFFVMIPKKNGKSSIAAAIIVVAAVLNERPNAELILIAETQKIAEISFGQAAGIIRLDEGLAAILDVKAHSKTILHLTTGATIRILSADGDVVTGSKAAYVLVDETHVLGHKLKAAGVFLELEGGLAARPEGFFLEITTQSKVRPHGEFKRRLDRARAVRDGKIDLPLLPLIYEFPPEMQESGAWRDEANWGLVNPNLERSVSLDYLRDKFGEAEMAGAESLALFASQHLNVQMGLGLHDDCWAGALFWVQAKLAEPLTLTALKARCDVAVVGVDGGGMDDLLGLTVIGRDRDTRQWLAWCRAWIHEIALQRRKAIAPKLLDFAQAGDLVICQHPTQDVDEIAELCMDLQRAGLLPEKNAIGMDPASSITAVVDAIESAGLDPTQIVPVSQGYRLTGAVKGAERRLFDGTLVHGGQPLLDWCVGNARVEPRGNAIIVTKAASGIGKIDPLMALFNAVTLMSWNPAGAERSFWEAA